MGWYFAIQALWFPDRAAMEGIWLTSQNTTLLEVVHTLSRIALAQFLPDQTCHHATHPLFTDNGVTGIVNSDVVLEVDSLIGWRNDGFFSKESGGLGGRHCGY